MILTQKRIFEIILQHLAALGVVVLTVIILFPIKAYLAVQIVVLIYLLPVVISTVVFGLSPGILAAFAASLAFNYFHIQPYHTFQVHGTTDVITLIIFLVLAVLISQLLGKAREGIRMAQRREWEATRMYELISSLAGLQTVEDFAPDFANHTLETFHCSIVQVKINQNNDDPEFSLVVPNQNIIFGDPDITIMMTTTREVEGELRLWRENLPLSVEEFRLLQAYSSQGALSIERIRLTKGENKTRILEESDKLKTSLLNSVSHELRSPLAAIKASVSSLRSKTIIWESGARQDLLATIEEETDHLNILVGHLLDMSRIESGALKPELHWNSLSEILMGVVTKMRHSLVDHQLEINLPGELPLVPTDYVLIEQVFMNLLSNSSKYAPSGTMIHVDSYVDGDYLHTIVANQGPPVHEGDLARIFDKFYRVTAADKVTGTGLGLSICKGIIEAHEGRIWAQNQPDKFEFHFLLPLTLHGSLPESPREVLDG